MSALGILFSLFGCKGKPDDGLVGTKGLGDKASANESGMILFDYSYNGSIGGDSYSFKVKQQKDDSILLTYYAMEYDSYGEMSMPMDASIFEELEALYRKHRVYRWEDFSLSDTNVLDGSGFSLSIAFQDGKHMSAQGSNAFPEGYADFVQELRALMRPYLDAMLETARTEKIEKGMEGALCSVLADFIQHGNSGSDSYEILLRSRQFTENTVDVRIISESGEFLEPGKYRWYGTLEDEAIGFEKIQELVDQYDIMKWYNFDEAAKDYNNEEWFQISLGYDHDSINACGTVHPEHYDAFRHDLLTYVIGMLKTAEATHPDLRSE